MGQQCLMSTVTFPHGIDGKGTGCKGASWTVVVLSEDKHYSLITFVGQSHQDTSQ